MSEERERVYTQAEFESALEEARAASIEAATYLMTQFHSENFHSRYSPAKDESLEETHKRARKGNREQDELLKGAANHGRSNGILLLAQNVANILSRTNCSSSVTTDEKLETALFFIAELTGLPSPNEMNFHPVSSLSWLSFSSHYGPSLNDPSFCRVLS